MFHASAPPWRNASHEAAGQADAASAVAACFANSVSICSVAMAFPSRKSGCHYKPKTGAAEAANLGSCRYEKCMERLDLESSRKLRGNVKISKRGWTPGVDGTPQLIP